MTKIILTRHGHVEGIVPPRFRGRMDVPLTETGRRQAKLLADLIARRYKPTAIYTSPLSRCVSTGAYIEKKTNIDTTILPELLDFDYGDWTGKTHTEIAQEDPERYERWWTQPQFVRPPNGDSLQAFVAHVSEAIRDVLWRHDGECVVLVGHDSTNRALLLTLMDLPFSAYWRFEQSPCAITEIDVTEKAVRVLSVNETLHLEDFG
ncbi:histidine phosphatase family protein [Brucella anthropi]|uniref:histidine phosphatase family protein n=1 Tax=Brucella anthropi TaxID=529 RepID=UPI000ACD9AE5|nr:histidine phosphatase family protein [Brucella anthropi]